MRIKTSDVLKGIVMAIGVVGVLTIAVVAPNLPMVFGQFYKSNKKHKPRQIKRSLFYAQQQGLISIGQEGDKTTIHLTENGEQRLLKYKLDDMRLPRSKKWDHKWRIIFFDIPEKFKANRNAFSLKLKEVGFKLLQKSVWVWPYDCKSEVDFLKLIYEVERFVNLAIVDEIDGERELAKKFGLA